MKHKFSVNKAGYYLYMVIIISIITCFFANIGNITTYGYDAKSGVVVNVDVGSWVNIRTNAGTSYDIVETLEKNHEVSVVGEKYAADGSLWYKIKFSKDDKNYTGYAHSNYIQISYVTDKEFENYLTKQGFPEDYKQALRALHTKYPNWTFQADHLNYTFAEVLEAENTLGRSLIESTSISSWKSLVGQAYDWTTGVWTGYDSAYFVQASSELVAYSLDPRNFLNEENIFMFMSLSYNSKYHTEDGVTTLIKGTFMEKGKVDGNMSYKSALMEAAEKSGVSPYHLASSIIYEISSLLEAISGIVPGYEGYYNYYNWGAYNDGVNTALVNGLRFAMGTDTTGKTMRPWNTQYKALVGGAIKFGLEYINRGQDTAYYKKFDLISPYYHQYMGHILGARSEGTKAASVFTHEIKKNTTFVFKIPVYKDMPEKVQACPTGDGSPNNALKALSVENVTLTPTFDKTKPISVKKFTATVPYKTKNVTITAKAYDSKAKITGTGEVKLEVGSNKFPVKVKAENGTTRTYTVTIIREEGSDDEPEYSTTLVVDKENGRIHGFSPKMTIQTVKKKFKLTNCSLYVWTKDSTYRKDDEYIVTGDKILIKDDNGKTIAKFNCILYGDVSGDGLINLKDALILRKHNLGTAKLKGSYLEAGDVDRAGNGINLKDALVLRKYNLGQKSINQK